MMEELPVFAVIRTHGAGWKRDAALEEQPDWEGHARFMDALHDDGFALLVGPLEGTEDALLVVRARDENDVESRLAGDPWTHSGLLCTTRVARWALRIGGV
jgi:uncharacterized protein YciI